MLQLKTTIPVILLTATLSVHPAIANVVMHTIGETTYEEVMKPASLITVEGGEATFLGMVQSKSLVTVTGGIGGFYGEIQNTVVFNLSGGLTIIDTLKNNAELNISGTAQLNLVQTVGNNATVNLQETGILQLENHDIIKNNAVLNASGGSILTQGYNLSVKETNLTGTTIIDLGGVSGNVDLGAISGPGDILFTNWTMDTAVQFGPGTTIDPILQLAFDGVETQMIGMSVTPVPEPAQTALVILGIVGVFAVYRRRS